jgi:hypothetical protein
MAAEPTETITVTAGATVFAKPDAARVHYTIRVNEPSIEEAKDSAAKLMKRMDESLKNLKLSDLATSSGAIAYSRGGTGRVRPGAFGAPGAAPAPKGAYSAQIPFTATIREKDSEKLRDAVDTFLKKIVESGASISGDLLDSDTGFTSAAAARLNAAESPRIDWMVSDESAARKEAYRQAVRKAKADAETLSKEIGWESMKVISVTDGASSTNTATSPRDILEPLTGISKGLVCEVPISVRVTLKCSR